MHLWMRAPNAHIPYCYCTGIPPGRISIAPLPNFVQPPVTGLWRRILSDLENPIKHSKQAHSYSRHVEWLIEFVKALDSKATTLFCQDWDVLLGLRVVADMPERFSRSIISNGMPLTGERKIPWLLSIWRFSVCVSLWLSVDRIVYTGRLRKLDARDRRAYCTFCDQLTQNRRSYLAAHAALRFDDPGAVRNRKARTILEQWKKPSLTVFSDRDFVTRERLPTVLQCGRTRIRSSQVIYI